MNFVNNNHKRSISDLPLDINKKTDPRKSTKRISVTPRKSSDLSDTNNKNTNKISCKNSILHNFKKKESTYFNNNNNNDLNSKSFYDKKNSTINININNNINNNFEILDMSRNKDLNKSKISDNSFRNLKRSLSKNNFDSTNNNNISKKKNSFFVGGFCVDLANKKITQNPEDFLEDDISLLPLSKKDNLNDDSSFTGSLNVFQNLRENLNDKNDKNNIGKLTRDKSSDLVNNNNNIQDLLEDDLYTDTNKGIKSIKSTKKKFEKKHTPTHSNHHNNIAKNPVNKDKADNNNINIYKKYKSQNYLNERRASNKLNSTNSTNNISNNTISVKKNDEEKDKNIKENINKETNNSEEEAEMTKMMRKKASIMQIKDDNQGLGQGQNNNNNKDLLSNKKRGSYNGIFSKEGGIKKQETISRCNMRKNHGDKSVSPSPLVRKKFLKKIF